MQNLQSGQTLKNVPMFLSYEAWENYSQFASAELVSALLPFIGSDIIAKSIIVRCTSSQPTPTGVFAFKVGKAKYDLKARYDEDASSWRIAYWNA